MPGKRKVLMQVVNIDDCSYVIADFYERTKQALLPRLHQLVAELSKDITKRPYKRPEMDGVLLYPRTMIDLVILPTGDWYSEDDWTSGNIISLIQYFLRLNVDEAIEWAWEEFIPSTSPDLDKRLVARRHKTGGGSDE